MNDTVKFMFIGLVQIAMYHYDMYVKVAYDNFDNKRRHDDDDVCNVHAPCLAAWNFQQFFYAICYLGHPLTFTENFTEIVPGERLRRRV